MISTFIGSNSRKHGIVLNWTIVHCIIAMFQKEILQSTNELINMVICLKIRATCIFKNYKYKIHIWISCAAFLTNLCIKIILLCLELLFLDPIYLLPSNPIFSGFRIHERSSCDLHTQMRVLKGKWFIPSGKNNVLHVFNYVIHGSFLHSLARTSIWDL